MPTTETRPTENQRYAALELLRAAGHGTSDCRLILVTDDSDGPGWIELRSFNGTKRLAIVALLMDGTPVSVL